VGGQTLKSPEPERAAGPVGHEKNDAETIKVVETQLQEALEFGVGARVASSFIRYGRGLLKVQGLGASSGRRRLMVAFLHWPGRTGFLNAGIAISSLKKP